MEDRPEATRKKDPFSVIVDALNEIEEHFAHTQKKNQAACTMVGVEDQNSLLEVLGELP